MHEVISFESFPFISLISTSLMKASVSSADAPPMLDMTAVQKAGVLRPGLTLRCNGSMMNTVGDGSWSTVGDDLWWLRIIFHGANVECF